MRRPALFLALALLPAILALSCAAPHKVMVVYDRPAGLKPGDRVLWENQVIGEVADFRANPSGKTVVPLKIKPDFRRAVTDRSRFLIQGDPDRPGAEAVRMVSLASGGQPLPDGAVVEGSTSFSLLVEKGSQGLRDLPGLFQEALDRLSKELGRLADQEWQRELERQLDTWARDLKNAGEEGRRYFRKEVLPRLERAVEDFLRRLRGLGKEKDGRSLEEKLDQLKRTLSD